MRKLNKTLAGLMAAVMVLLGVSVTPVEADAATIASEGVHCAKANDYDIAKYWPNRKAPVKDGYVFGGWYTKDNGEAIKETDLQKDYNSETKSFTTYKDAVAKFVPSYILSVKMQLEKPTSDANGVYTVGETTSTSTYIRLLSAVDSVKYENVGFDIKFNKTVPFDDTENKKTCMSTVYSNLKASGDTITAEQYFGTGASHFIALKISDILKDNFEKVIYVTPYWTTMDGTKVEGVSKYVRVMDLYAKNQFISIPVNLSVEGQAAAGMVTMTYDKDKLQFVDAKDSNGNAYGWDAGVSLAEMAVNTANEGTIKFVGNGKEVDKDFMTGTDLYANVWFQVKKDVTLTTNGLEFTIGTESFCTWGEAMLDDGEVIAWDVCY